MDMPMDKEPRRRTIVSQAIVRGPLPALPEGLLGELVKVSMAPLGRGPDARRRQGGIERTMSAESKLHLSYPPGAHRPDDQANEHNNPSGKTIITDHGLLRFELPQDREGSFESAC